MEKFNHTVQPTYGIGDLCREFDLTPRALRFYEERGLIVPARKQGRRVYSIGDRARVSLIVRGRKAKLSLAEIRDILLAYRQGGRDKQNKRALDIFKARISDLESQKIELESAINSLIDACIRIEKETCMTTD